MVANFLARRGGLTPDAISHPPHGCDLQGGITLQDFSTLVTPPPPAISTLTHWELFLYLLLLPKKSNQTSRAKFKCNEKCFDRCK